MLQITYKFKPLQVNHIIQLGIVPSAKYIGVHIDSNLSWKTQNTYLGNKANNTLAFIQQNLFNSLHMM